MIGNRNSREASQSAPDDFSKALDWEASRIALNELSQRRAWRIVWVIAGLLVLSWVAIVLMMPLKQTVPYIIRVNNATGYIQQRPVAQIETTLRPTPLLGSEQRPVPKLGVETKLLEDIGRMPQ